MVVNKLGFTSVFPERFQTSEGGEEKRNRGREAIEEEWNTWTEMNRNILTFSPSSSLQFISLLVSPHRSFLLHLAILPYNGMLLRQPRPTLHVCQLSFKKAAGAKGEETRWCLPECSQFQSYERYNINNGIPPQVLSPLSQGASLSACVITRVG